MGFEGFLGGLAAVVVSYAGQKGYGFIRNLLTQSRNGQAAFEFLLQQQRAMQIPRAVPPPPMPPPPSNVIPFERD